MAKQKSGKSTRNPARVKAQLFRTFRNKQKQRERHMERYPKDTESIARAKRWV